MLDDIKDINEYDHDFYMSIAIEEAILAGERGDKAIGAVLVHGDKIIGKSSNTWNTRNSKVHHAENWLVIENAQYLKKYGNECIIYTTAEPCLMCIGTIVMGDIKNIVIGTEDPHMHTREFIQSHEWLRNKISNYIIGVKKNECIELIKKYCDKKTQKRLLENKDYN